MGIKTRPSLLHWNYFLALEEDIERLSRYVNFSKKNFKVYSIEIAHIYLAASSEVDVVAKLLSKKIDPNSDADNIKKYRGIIDPTIPSLKNEIVSLPRYGLELNPWFNWNDNKSPDWWDDYNNVKHHREKYFKRANLKNVLNAMAGLFLVILHYYKGMPGCDRFEPPPSIFIPPPEIAHICTAIGGRLWLFYSDNPSN